VQLQCAEQPLPVLFDADDATSDSGAGVTRGLRVGMATAPEVVFICMTDKRERRLRMKRNKGRAQKLASHT
jgi:hypothetical protein